MFWKTCWEKYVIKKIFPRHNEQHSIFFSPMDIGTSASFLHLLYIKDRIRQKKRRENWKRQHSYGAIPRKEIMTHALLHDQQTQFHSGRKSAHFPTSTEEKRKTAPLFLASLFRSQKGVITQTDWCPPAAPESSWKCRWLKRDFQSMTGRLRRGNSDLWSSWRPHALFLFSIAPCDVRSQINIFCVFGLCYSFRVDIAAKEQKLHWNNCLKERW